MRHQTEFTWDIFINMINYLSYKDRIIFTKLEEELLRCHWNNLSRHDILKVLDKKRLELKYYYKNDHFFSMGFELNLMRKLSTLANHRVNKSNFKEVFQWIWERDNRANIIQDRSA